MRFCHDICPIRYSVMESPVIACDKVEGHAGHHQVETREGIWTWGTSTAIFTRKGTSQAAQASGEEA